MATKNRSNFDSFKDGQEKLWQDRISDYSKDYIINTIDRLRLGDVKSI
ncbi:MAG: hypothetical protein JKY19_04345 [Alcanivoracaceae bacterium]|nr:hypothetical protein [Alcanivoracaceae bacterium]